MKQPYLALCVVAAAAGSACGQIVVGLGEGGAPEVRVFDGLTGSQRAAFLAYDPQFTGGVRVAAGDVTGDGTPDIITGAGPGGGPHVKVFSGLSGALPVASFLAYSPNFLGGVHVAAGRVDRDPNWDIVTGAGAGAGPHVKVFSGATGGETASFFPFTPSFTGGVRVASGDVNNDGFADVIAAAGPGGAGHVQVYSGSTGGLMSSFFAYGASFTGGVFVSAGDVDGDLVADIITGADAGGAPHVKVFSGATGQELASFLAFEPNFTGGVRVAAADLNGDGFAEIVAGAGPGGGPHVRVFDGATGALLSSFLAADPNFTGGVYVAAIPAPGAAALLLPTLCLAARRRRA